MAEIIFLYLIIAGSVLAMWVMLCCMEAEFELNLFIALVNSLFWPLALLHLTVRYAVPWVAGRLYRDAVIALARKPRPEIEAKAAPRAPSETGIYD